MSSAGVRRWLFVAVAGVVATMALTTPAAASAPADDPKVVVNDDPAVVAAANCPQLMNDTGPRYFNVYTIDSSPRGARTQGYVWVDRTSPEYRVCVGWPDGSDPFPWAAYLNDQEHGNNREALAVVQFTDNGARFVLTDSTRWNVINGDRGWSFRSSSISNFYVGVCLHIRGSAVADHCGWERGAVNYTSVPLP